MEDVLHCTTYWITEFSNAFCLPFKKLQFLFKCTSYRLKSESFTTSWHNKTEMELPICICWSIRRTSSYSILLCKRLKAISIMKHVLAVTNKNVLFSLLPKDLKRKMKLWLLKSYLKNRIWKILTKKKDAVLIPVFWLSSMHLLIACFKRLSKPITEI